MKRNNRSILHACLVLALLGAGACSSGGGDSIPFIPLPQNAVPVAADQAVTTDEDVPVGISLQASDGDGEALSFNYGSPSHGTLSGTAPDLTYTPQANYYGPDSFTFTANDGTDTSPAATVMITVNPVNDAFPVANDLNVATNEDQQLIVALDASDIDNDHLIYSYSAPAHGTLSGSTPDLTYQPNANYNGGDSFTYSANDGWGNSNVATVTITVNAVNDTPVASAGPDAMYNGGESVFLSGSGVDVEGDALTYSWQQLSGPAAPLNDARAQRPRLMVPQGGGVMEYRVTVSDGTTSSTDTVLITGLAYSGATAATFDVNPFVRFLPHARMRALAVGGSYAYVLADYSGLSIYDMTNPNVPVLVSSYMGASNQLQTGVSGAVLAGNYLYIVRSNGIDIVNVATPASPAIVSRYAFATGTVTGIAVSGSYVFVAHSTNVLAAINVTNPSLPSLLWTLSSTPWTGDALAVSGGYAYLATTHTTTGAKELQIINVSTPAGSISYVGSVVLTSAVRAVAVASGYAYLASGFPGLQVIDVRAPATPLFVRTVATAASAENIVVANGRAFVAASEAGIEVFDLTAPSDPQLIGRYQGGSEIYASMSWVGAMGAYVYGGQWGLYGKGGVYYFDVSSPKLPSLLGSYSTGYYEYGISLHGDTLYASFSGAGLHALDISTPSAPVHLSTYRPTGGGFGSVAVGSTLYALVSGLEVLSIADPTAPAYLGQYPSLYSTSQRIDAAGGYVYVPDVSSGLNIINAADPSAPVLAGSFGTAGRASAVKVIGNRAFVADWGSGLQIINVSDPSSPTLAGGLSTIGIAADLDVDSHGLHAYVATDRNGLRIIDVANSASIVLLGTYDLGTASAVAISGGYAVVGDDDRGVQIVDVSDPASPSLAGSYGTPGMFARVVRTRENLIYVGDGLAGVQIGELHPTMRNVAVAAPKAVLDYVIGWTDTQDPEAEQVACYVSGGTCAVISPNAAANSATVRWSLPNAAGDYELIVAVGTQHYFLTNKDRVEVR